MVGVAPIDFDVKSSSYDTCGWYLHCSNERHYSGPPYNYLPPKEKGKKASKLIPYETINYEIIIIMNMNKRTIKFIVNGEDKGELYTEIPIDKPLSPAVFLYNKDDSVEIIKC